jgi:DNA-binding response OmpR family regulator
MERAMGSGKQRILCIDNDSDICELYTIVFPEFEIVSASCRAQGIEMARKGGFSLILLESHLPDGTSRTTCENIREFDTETPILFITGSRSFSDLLALYVGAQGTVRKMDEDFINELKSKAASLVGAG